MSTRFLLVSAFLLLVSAAAFAQGEVGQPFAKSYSIEIGTGIRPLQMMFGPTRAARELLAPKGQDVDTQGEYFPTLSLTGVLRLRPDTELTLTAGTSWYHHKVIQYPIFGTDPYGNPRYDLTKGTPAGWMNSIYSYSATFQWRHLWNPDRAFVLYTALGAGATYTSSSHFFPLLSITPIAARYGGKHIYGFAELTLGPIATLAHGGLGWRF